VLAIEEKVYLHNIHFEIFTHIISKYYFQKSLHAYS